MPTESPDADRLESWKAIAVHLDRQVRTVQRWEKEEGLPVHRLPHKKRGSVYALKSELDAWRQRSPALIAAPEPAAAAAPAPRRRRVGWAIAAASFLALAAGWWMWARSRPPAPLPASAWGRLLAASTRAGGAPRLLPMGPAPGVEALSPDGATLYVGDEQDGSLRLVDTATLRVRALLHLDGAIGALALSPDGGRLYVGHSQAGGLDIVDTARLSTRRLPTAGVVTDIAVSPDGGPVFLALTYAGLDELDPASLSLRHLTGPACPSVLAFGPGGRRLYIDYQCGGGGGRSGHDAVGIWDVAQRALVGRLSGPPQIGNALAVSPDGNELWEGMGDACSAPAYDHQGCLPGQVSGINVYSLGEQKLLRSLPLSLAPVHLAFLPGNTRVLVSGSGLSVLDTTRMSVLEHLNLPLSTGLAVMPDGSRAFVSLPLSHALAVYTASPAACAPPTDGLIGWWPGDGTADDARGVNHGRWSGAPAYAPGRFGQALRFTGANRVDLGHDSTLLAAPTLGWAAWLKPAGAAEAVIAGKFLHGRGWQLRSLKDGRLSFCLGDGSPSPGGCGATPATRLETARPLSAGQWHFVALSIAAGGATTLYLDGKQAAAAHLDTRVLEAASADLQLGGPGWLGLMDEVVYYHQLASAQRRQLMALPACVAH